MAEIVGPKGKVYAADSDDRSILALRLKAAKLGYENRIEAHATSAGNLSFIPDSSVDFVFANGLLCCMVDHAGAITEIKRILKPGGRAYLSFRKVRRKKDPRAVSNDEWRRILASFILLREGEGLVRRWTLVSVT